MEVVKSVSRLRSNVGLEFCSFHDLSLEPSLAQKKKEKIVYSAYAVDKKWQAYLRETSLHHLVIVSAKSLLIVCEQVCESDHDIKV